MNVGSVMSFLCVSSEQELKFNVILSMLAYLKFCVILCMLNCSSVWQTRFEGLFVGALDRLE